MVSVGGLQLVIDRLGYNSSRELLAVSISYTVCCSLVSLGLSFLQSYSLVSGSRT